MRPIRTPLNEDHPDYPILATLRDEIARKAGGLANLQVKFPGIVRDAIDFVLDPVRTARTKVKDLDNVEKTFIGLK
jgi:phage terminase Nu1 subunit (DNA packaging protein)